jgi:hypothetical protein
MNKNKKIKDTSLFSPKKKRKRKKAPSLVKSVRSDHKPKAQAYPANERKAQQSEGRRKFTLQVPRLVSALLALQSDFMGQGFKKTTQYPTELDRVGFRLAPTMM